MESEQRHETAHPQSRGREFVPVFSASLFQHTPRQSTTYIDVRKSRLSKIDNSQSHTHLAIGLIKTRLDDTYGPDIRKTYEVIGEPTDVAGAEQLALENKYQLKYWSLGLCGARPTEGIKKGADRGPRLLRVPDGSTSTKPPAVTPDKSSFQSREAGTSASPRFATCPESSSASAPKSASTSPSLNPPAPCAAKPPKPAFISQPTAPAISGSSSSPSRDSSTAPSASNAPPCLRRHLQASPPDPPRPGAQPDPFARPGHAAEVTRTESSEKLVPFCKLSAETHRQCSSFPLVTRRKRTYRCANAVASASNTGLFAAKTVLPDVKTARPRPGRAYHRQSLLP